MAVLLRALPLFIVLTLPATGQGTGSARSQPDLPAATAGAPSVLVPGSRFDIQTVVGFSNTFRLGRWTPITVIVSNRGHDLLGELEVQTTGGNELQGDLFTTTHVRNLELPRDSRKRVRFTVFLKSFTRPLVVRVTSGGREMARRRVDLRARYTTSGLIVVLSRDANLDYLNDNRGEGRRVLYPHPEMLPDRWQGYDGVDALVIHGVSLEHLTARQYRALEKWIGQGGIVATSGGPHFSLLRTPRLAALLPGTPVGVVQFPDGAALGDSLGEPLLALRPFVVNRVRQFRGRAIYRAGDVPLVIEARQGRGRVLYLTFDVARYPFDRWSAMEEIWLRSLRLPEVEPASFRPREAEEATAVLPVLRAQTLGFPGHFIVFVFLTLYLGALATGYRLRPTEKGLARLVAWLTFALPLAFAPAAYLLFGPLLFPKGATAVVVSVIEPIPGSSYANLKLDIGAYSNRRGRLSLRYEGPEPVFRPASLKRRNARRGRSGGRMSWVFHEGAIPSVRSEDPRRYVLQLLSGRDVIAYDLQASAAMTGAGLRFHLTNHSGDLVDAWLLFGERAYPLGPIPVGSEIVRTLGAGSDGIALDEEPWPEILTRPAGLTVPGLESAFRALLKRELGESRADARPEPGEALVVGFSNGPLRLAGPSASWRRRELALVVNRIAVTSPSPEIGG